MKKSILILSMLLGAVLSQANEIELYVTQVLETEKEIKVLNPHTYIDDKGYRFSANKKTYEGLCSLIQSDHSLSLVEGGFKTQGTVFLKASGEVLRWGPVFQSFKFVKCIK